VITLAEWEAIKEEERTYLTCSR